MKCLTHHLSSRQVFVERSIEIEIVRGDFLDDEDGDISSIEEGRGFYNIMLGDICYML
jgi:hypothetical protein